MRANCKVPSPTQAYGFSRTAFLLKRGRHSHFSQRRAIGGTPVPTWLGTSPGFSNQLWRFRLSPAAWHRPPFSPLNISRITRFFGEPSVTLRNYRNGRPQYLIKPLITSRPLPEAPPQLSNGPVAKDDVDWLRQASAKAPDSSYFLFSAPGLYTTLSDEEFHDSVWFRLGLPAAAGHDECVPNPKNDPFGLHRLGCKAAAGARLRRHNALAGVIASFALKADPRAFQVEREVSGIADQTSREWPGDVAMDLGDGRTLLDITVVNQFSAARLRASRSAGSPAVAAEEGYDKKVRKYAPLLGAGAVLTRCRFVPFSVTAAGEWDERSIKWLRKLAAVFAASTGVDTGSAFSDLMTRLSMELWRGNSAILRACRAADWDFWTRINFVNYI